MTPGNLSSTLLNGDKFIEPNYPSVDDPYANQVSLLLGADGVYDGMTTSNFQDLASNLPLTPVGVVVKGSPIGVFGGRQNASYLFNSYSYLNVPSTTALALGSSNFTIEVWVYSSVADQNLQQVVFSNYTGSFGANAIYFGKHTTYAGRMAFWSGSVSTSAAVVVDPSPMVPDTWIHYAVVRNGTTITMYRNGVSVSTGTIGASTAVTATSQTAYVGVGSGNGFSGMLNDFRITKAAVYTAAFIPAASPMPTLTTTILHTCADTYIVDRSPNALAITTVGETTNSPPYVYGMSPYKSAQAYTPDSSSSILYTGSSKLTTPSNTSLNMGTGAWTVDFWVYPTVAVVSSAYRVFFSRRGGSTPCSMQGHTANNTGYIGFYSDTTGEVNSTTTMSYGVWNHIAYTYDGTTLRVFKNGTMIVSRAFAFVDRDLPFTIGNDSGTQYFIGAMADFRVSKGINRYPNTSYTIPTTRPTVDANTVMLVTGNNANVMDQTRLGFIQKLGSATVSKTRKRYGNGSMLIESGSAYVVAPHYGLDMINDFTIELWYYQTSAPAAGGGMILCKGGGTGIGYASYEIMVTGTNTVCFAATTNNSGYQIGGENATGAFGVLRAKRWNHIAVTRQGSTFRAFLNGVQGFTQTNSAKLYISSSYGLAIGCNFVNTWNGTPANVAPGYYDDIRITKGTARYTANFTPPGRLTNNMGYAVALKATDTAVTDIGPAANPLTVSSGVSYVDGQFGKALYFPGTSYATNGLTFNTASNLTFGTNEFTIQTWIKAERAGGVFFDGRPQGTNGWWPLLYVNDSGLLTWNANAGVAPLVTGTTQLVNTGWHHVAVTRSRDGNIRIFVDGNLEATSALATTQAFSAHGANRPEIGFSGTDLTTASRLYKGFIEGLTIHNGACLWTASFTKPTGLYGS